MRTFQSLELFEDLTVEDNLLVAAEQTRWYTPLLDMVHVHRSSPDDPEPGGLGAGDGRAAARP